MKLGTQIHRHHQTDEENPYWISFSDIMAGLLVIFILAALALILELTQTRVQVTEAIQDLAKAERVRRDIVQEIAEELKKRDINVEVSENQTVIRIPDDLLSFRTNSHSIPYDRKVRAAALEVGKTLHLIITKDDRWRYLDTIFIEGHTDKRRSNREMGNWGLSTSRAISVWSFWNDNMPNGMKLDELKNHTGIPLFSVSGYGETRPLPGDQVSEEQLKKNRRIDIRLTVRRPEIGQYKKIEQQLRK